jgi:hypothetical protein
LVVVVVVVVVVAQQLHAQVQESRRGLLRMLTLMCTTLAA